jgi:predicted membrane protein
LSSEDKFDPNKLGQDLHDRIHQRIRDSVGGGRDRMAALHSRTRVIPGLILVIIGTAILLDHMGILPIDRIWKFWPMILIFVGATRLLESRNRMFGLMMMIVGAIFQLSTLGYLRITVADFWPIVIIAIGLGLIWSRFELPKLNPTSPDGPNKISAATLFGGVERRVNMSNFAGGTVTATFGGVELDFRSADIEGDEAVLYVEAVFGGIELVVPERWTVIYEGQSIFGGYNDETRPPLAEVPGGPARKRLILRGQALFGGITVKN